MNHNLLGAFNHFMDFSTPECPNCSEITLAGVHRFLITKEPEHIKGVLTTKFADFGKGPMFHRNWSPFLGDSIFTTDGKLWQDSRSLIRPMFMKDRVRDLAIFERWADLLITKLPAPGVTVDIMDLFYRMTLDVTTDFLLGDSVNALDKLVHRGYRNAGC
jgi:cytochrome P450